MAKTTLAQTALTLLHTENGAPWSPFTLVMDDYALGIGFTHVDVALALGWLKSELRRQEPNGRIPHKQVQAATTPPFYPILLWNWWRKAPDQVDLPTLFPALLRSQLYWYEQRDPLETGLPCIQFAEEALRPELYQDRANSTPFQVQDPAFLAMLCRANECLIELGQALGADVSAVLQGQELSVFGLNEDLWNEDLGQYQAQDLEHGPLLVDARNLLQYLPLWAGVPDQEQAEQLCRTLIKTFFQEEYWLLPLHAPGTAAEADSTVSLLFNRLLYLGLLRYGFKDSAGLIREQVLNLVGTYGFYPYYQSRMDPYDNIGLGQGAHLPSAALALDFANGVPEKRGLEQIW